MVKDTSDMRGRPGTSELPKTQRIVCDALGTGTKSLKRKNAGLIGSGGRVQEGGEGKGHSTVVKIRNHKGRYF